MSECVAVCENKQLGIDFNFLTLRWEMVICEARESNVQGSDPRGPTICNILRSLGVKLFSNIKKL